LATVVNKNSDNILLKMQRKNFFAGLFRNFGRRGGMGALPEAVCFYTEMVYILSAKG